MKVKIETAEEVEIAAWIKIDWMDIRMQFLYFQQADEFFLFYRYFKLNRNTNL